MRTKLQMPDLMYNKGFWYVVFFGYVFGSLFLIFELADFLRMYAGLYESHLGGSLNSVIWAYDIGFRTLGILLGILHIILSIWVMLYAWEGLYESLKPKKLVSRTVENIPIYTRIANLENSRLFWGVSFGVFALSALIITFGLWFLILTFVGTLSAQTGLNFDTARGLGGAGMALLRIVLAAYLIYLYMYLLIPLFKLARRRKSCSSE